MQEPEHIKLAIDGKLSRGIPDTPQSIEMEMAILGGVMILPEKYSIAAEYLTPESFYFNQHGLIFKIMAELTAAGQPPDSTLILDALGKLGRKDELAGDILLMLNMASPANVEAHAKEISKKALLRAMIRAGYQIIEECYKQELSLDDIAQMAHSAAMMMGGGSLLHSGQLLEETVAKYWEGLMERAAQIQELRSQGKSAKLMRGLGTGFYALDMKLRGLRAKQLIIVGAASSMGKTAFSLEIARFLAVDQHVPVAFYTLEMGADEITERLISMQSLYTTADGKLKGIPSHRLDNPEFTGAEEHSLERARELLSMAPLYIHEPGSMGIEELRASLRREIREHGIQLCIVDYLGFIRSNLDDRAGGYAKVSQISGGLKQTARELNIPLIVPHQLSRAMAGRANKRPLLSDLRDSGTVEQDADIVIFLYRDEYYSQQPSMEGLPVAELIIAKNRNGPIGMIEARWFQAIARFLPAARS